MWRRPDPYMTSSSVKSLHDTERPRRLEPRDRITHTLARTAETPSAFRRLGFLPYLLDHCS